MSTTYPQQLPAPTLPGMPGPVVNVPVSLDRRVIYEALALMVPAWLLTSLGYPTYGSYWYFSLLGALFGWHWVHKAPHRISAMLLATLPTMNIFRNYFFYNSPQIIYLAAVVLWIEYRRRQAGEMLKDRVLMALFGFSVVYWWLSFLITEDYSINFRALELSLCVASMTLLYSDLSRFRTAMLALGIGILIQGAALMQHGDRLGFAEIAGGMVGNPISFGIPACVLFLLSITRGGRWIMVKDSPWWRYALSALAGAALLLSTSRGSWLAAIVGLIMIFLFDRRQRVTLGLYAVGLVVFALALTQTPQGATFADYLDRTFGGDISLDKRTTGRAEQWAAFPKILEASPLWGHGPGMGRQVAAEFAGRYLALHSLYLQVGSELGLIGLGLIGIFFWFMFRRGWYYLKKFDEPVPLIGSVAFATIGLSVPAIDLTSALLLALGMIRLRGQVYRVVPAPPPPKRVPAAPWSWREPASQGEEPA